MVVLIENFRPGFNGVQKTLLEINQLTLIP
jgi:hypothetical protein